MMTSSETDTSRDRDQNSDSEKEELSSDEREMKVPPLKLSLKRQKHDRLSSSEDNSEHNDIAKDDAESTARDKKLKAVDIKNPFSTFEKQTKRKKSHLPATKFVKEQWFAIRGFDTDGKFIIGDETKYDSWKKVTPSEKILKKYGGEVFSETKLDDGLHSVVAKDLTKTEAMLKKNQRVLGSIAHLSLSAMEYYGKIYGKISELVTGLVGNPTLNPDWNEGDPADNKYLWDEHQNKGLDLENLLAELQVDVSEPISNISRMAAAHYTDTLDKRRSRVLSGIKKNNPSVATAVEKIFPSATTMFGGDHSRLEKVVKLTKDLSKSGKPKSDYKHKAKGNFMQTKNPNFRKGSGSGKRSREDDNSDEERSKPRKFRSGNASKGKAKKH